MFARRGATVIADRYNQPNALFGTLPGGYRRLHRKHVILCGERADLALWAIAGQGEKRNPHLGTESLAVLRTRHQTPFHLNLHVGDVAHTMVTGATGAGKSTLASWLVGSFQKHEPFTVIFDQGGSFEGMVEAFGGRTVRVVAGDPSFQVNPFAHALTPEHHEFLALFVRTLAESDGGAKIAGPQAREIYEEVRNLYGLGPELRTLTCLAKGLAKSTRERLHPWLRGGQHGELFDNVRDSLTFSDLQYFDFPKQADPRVMAAVLLHVFQRVNEVVLDPQLSGRLKMLVIDEGEIFARNPQLCAHIVEAVKTWRKHNGAVVWMGQSIDALLADAEIERNVLRPLVQSCATQIFLSNPAVNGDYSRLFGLSAEQVAAVRGLRAKDEILVKQGDRVTRLSTSLDPVNLWLATTKAEDRARRAELFQKHGAGKALDILTAKEEER